MLLSRIASVNSSKMSSILLYSAMLLCGLISVRQIFLNSRFTRFNNYLQKFNKSYSDQEFVMRMLNFEESLKEIEKLNSKEHGTGAVHGLTKFSDWSKDEITEHMLMNTFDYHGCSETTTINCLGTTSERLDVKTEGYQDPPDSLDWRDRGVIGLVQDQKKCNGCWAFSIVGVMESMAAITWGVLEQLSVQELLDCSDVNDHCNGGNIDTGLWFLCNKPFVNLTTVDKYPLMLINEDCKSKPAKGRRIKSYEIRCNVEDDDIMQSLMHGPVIVVINHKSWLSYNSGIIRTHCDSEQLEMLHVVQIVGYGVTSDDEGAIEYYIIRNSWGVDWGEDGYMRLGRGKNLNLCGVRDHVAKLDVLK